MAILASRESKAEFLLSPTALQVNPTTENHLDQNVNNAKVKKKKKQHNAKVELLYFTT